MFDVSIRRGVSSLRDLPRRPLDGWSSVLSGAGDDEFSEFNSLGVSTLVRPVFFETSMGETASSLIVYEAVAGTGSTCTVKDSDVAGTNRLFLRSRFFVTAAWPVTGVRSCSESAMGVLSSKFCARNCLVDTGAPDAGTSLTSSESFKVSRVLSSADSTLILLTNASSITDFVATGFVVLSFRYRFRFFSAGATSSTSAGFVASVCSGEGFGKSSGEEIVFVGASGDGIVASVSVRVATSTPCSADKVSSSLLAISKWRDRKNRFDGASVGEGMAETHSG